MRKLSVFFLFTMLFLFIPLVSAHTITVPTNVYFGIPAYGTYINFNTEKTFDNVHRENNYWYFNGYGFQVQNANMTITQFFISNKLIFTVSAPSGTTSTTKVYVGDKADLTQVYTTNGTLTWSYNASTRILTLNVLHNSSANILVDWGILGDVNGDGKVDASDLTELSETYGGTSTLPKWDSNCDLNRDNIINVQDLYPLGKNYGKTKP